MYCLTCFVSLGVHDCINLCLLSVSRQMYNGSLTSSYFPSTQILPEHRGLCTTETFIQVKKILNNEPYCSFSTTFSSCSMHIVVSDSVSTLGLFPRRCLTCGLKEECLFFDADVSPDAQHAILHCKGQR